MTGSIFGESGHCGVLFWLPRKKKEKGPRRSEKNPFDGLSFCSVKNKNFGEVGPQKKKKGSCFESEFILCFCQQQLLLKQSRVYVERSTARTETSRMEKKCS